MEYGGKDLWLITNREPVQSSLIAVISPNSPEEVNSSPKSVTEHQNSLISRIKHITLPRNASHPSIYLMSFSTKRMVVWYGRARPIDEPRSKFSPIEISYCSVPRVLPCANWSVNLWWLVFFFGKRKPNLCSQCVKCSDFKSVCFIKRRSRLWYASAFLMWCVVFGSWLCSEICVCRRYRCREGRPMA